MSGRTFQPEELGAEGAFLVGVARRLEGYAAEVAPAPSAGLADRIMEAVAEEPVPTPPARFSHGILAGSLGTAWAGFMGSVQAALGLGRAFPAAVRLQAIVVVLAVVLTVVGGATLVAGGVGAMLRRPRAGSHAIRRAAVAHGRAQPESDGPAAADAYGQADRHFDSHAEPDADSAAYAAGDTQQPVFQR